MTDIAETILETAGAFVYRCRNDDSYTMEAMFGDVASICGYSTDDLLENARHSFGELMHKDDIDRVVAEVDRCVAARERWDVEYRLVQKSGSIIPVRERGCGVFEGDTLLYLQGLIADASAETKLRDSMQSAAATTEESNQEILAISKNILSSIKHLTVLSINARVEAARSGEAGRGFAVVADEINRLALDNKEWAEQIATKMNDRH